MNEGENQNRDTAPPQEGAQVVAGEASKNTLMGILAYLGILILIPFLMAKDDPFVKFHIKQGLVLIVIWAVLWVLGVFIGPMISMFMPLISLLHLATIILAIVGIVNVVQGNEKELPLVGQFAKYFTF